MAMWRKKGGENSPNESLVQTIYTYNLVTERSFVIVVF